MEGVDTVLHDPHRVQNADLQLSLFCSDIPGRNKIWAEIPSFVAKCINERRVTHYVPQRRPMGGGV